jgi:hypothetical protein
MPEMDMHRHMPSLDRLSTLIATILLAYALGRFIRLPARELSVQLPSLYLVVQINAQTFVGLIVAGLTASGTKWLLQDHPALGKRSSLEHWLLPALTSLVIGLPLFQLPLSPVWWLGFALGGVLLTLVLLAEYIVVDPEDVRYAPAAAGLTAVSFALYLVLAAALKFSGYRLFILMPTLALAGGLVSLRALNLRLHGQWAYMQAGIVALITVQIAAALHYWQLSPVTFGLALLGPAYALTNLSGNLAEDEPVRQAIIEPIAVLSLVWGTAFWIR